MYCLLRSAHPTCSAALHNLGEAGSTYCSTFHGVCISNFFTSVLRPGRHQTLPTKLLNTGALSPPSRVCPLQLVLASHTDCSLGPPLFGGRNATPKPCVQMLSPGPRSSVPLQAAHPGHTPPSLTLFFSAVSHTPPPFGVCHPATTDPVTSTSAAHKPTRLESVTSASAA